MKCFKEVIMLKALIHFNISCQSKRFNQNLETIQGPSLNQKILQTCKIHTEIIQALDFCKYLDHLFYYLPIQMQFLRETLGKTSFKLQPKLLTFIINNQILFCLEQANQEMFLKLGRPTYVFSCLPKLSSMPAESGSSSHTHSTTVSCCQ